MTIEPINVTNFNRTDAELELFWIFCIVVAGKNAEQVAWKVSKMFATLLPGETPFSYLRENSHALHNMLVANRIGQYYRIEKAIMSSLDLNLRECKLEDLLSIFGVGPKTARFFLVHSRPNAEHVVLDVHVLRYLAHRWKMDVPEQSPSAAEYDRIEKVAVPLLRSEFKDMSMAEIDLLIWASLSGRLNESPMMEVAA
jgi:thermostable 8-oxoguanine DNA glycosylase